MSDQQALELPSIAVASVSKSASSKTPRSSAWTCRLPAEILSFVCESSARKKEYDTLAMLSQTSSATYTLVIPYLYRHLDLDLNDAILLFSLFNEFPRSENRYFLDAIPTDMHLIDLHLAHRLRSWFSHTTRLKLSVEYDVELHATDYEACMERYKELFWGMSAFGGPTLWSSLDRCEIDLDPIGRPSGDEIFSPSNYAPLTDIVFSKLHPAHLVVRLPDQSILMENHGQAPDWAPCLRRLQGHHIEVIDYSPIVTSDLP